MLLPVRNRPQMLVRSTPVAGSSSEAVTFEAASRPEQFGKLCCPHNIHNRCETSHSQDISSGARVRRGTAPLVPYGMEGTRALCSGARNALSIEDTGALIVGAPAAGERDSPTVPAAGCPERQR